MLNFANGDIIYIDEESIYTSVTELLFTFNKTFPQ